MQGELVAGYRIVGTLDECGRGTVHAGEHATSGARAVVKVYRAEHGADPDVVERFCAEVRAAARIPHPGMVQVFEVGVLENGAPFIVMEHLTGESLQDRMRRGRPPIATTVALGRQIASAVGALCQAGHSNLDLSPARLWLVPDATRNEGSRVMVLGIGDVTLRQATRHLTGPFVMPTYVSPEQCRGAASVDERAVVYSVGCILYEMVAGKPPLWNENALTLVMAHLTEAPVPLHELVADVPAQLGDAIMRTLAKAAGDRFASLRELESALQSIEVR